MWSGVKPNLAGTYCKFYLRGNSSEKNILRFLLNVVYFCLTGKCYIDREPVKDIQVEELHSKMQDPVFMEEAQLIDVREPDEM